MSNQVKGFFGLLLLTVGVLMVGLCGACTAYYFALGVLGHEELGGILVLGSLIVGAPAIALGAGLILAGRRMRTRR